MLLQWNILHAAILWQYTFFSLKTWGKLETLTNSIFFFCDYNFRTTKLFLIPMPFLDSTPLLHDSYNTKQYMGIGYNVLSWMIDERVLIHPFNTCIEFQICARHFSRWTSDMAVRKLLQNPSLINFCVLGSFLMCWLEDLLLGLLIFPHTPMKKTAFHCNQPLLLCLYLRV